jgi:hypothetical protein
LGEDIHPSAMHAKKYLYLFIFFTLLSFSCLAVVNYVVDPYRFFDSADRPGVNEYRQRFFYGQYVSKPYALREQAPEAVILGVSRAGSSLATDHPGWLHTHVYNYAMAGSTAYLMWRNYQHAKASGELKKVVLMLDFYMFNVHYTRHVRDYEERLAVNSDFSKNYGLPVRFFKDTVSSLISFEMLYESWNTVLAQSKIAKQTLYKATLTPTGFWINEPYPNRPQRRLFGNIESQYMTITWFPRPEQKFSLQRGDGSTNLVYLQKILADAHREGIDLRLGFMPFHARLAESMRIVGIWSDFEQWKKEVVGLIEKEAAAANQPPFPIWDFTGYNSITTEPVPLRDDMTTRMKWHLDPSHVSRAAGDLMQNLILGTGGERHDDFGQLVTSSNIEAYISRSHIRREAYVKIFPKDIEEIKRRADKTSRWRNKP